MAQEKYPGVPHIAMGHLTAMNEAEVVGSAPQNVHVAVENGMDGDIFGTTYDYVALGHIHKKIIVFVGWQMHIIVVLHSHVLSQRRKIL